MSCLNHTETDDDAAFENWRHRPENLDADGFPRAALTKPFAPFDICEHMRQTILSVDKAARLGVAKDDEPRRPFLGDGS